MHYIVPQNQITCDYNIFKTDVTLVIHCAFVPSSLVCRLYGLSIHTGFPFGRAFHLVYKLQWLLLLFNLPVISQEIKFEHSILIRFILILLYLCLSILLYLCLFKITLGIAKNLSDINCFPIVCLSIGLNLELKTEKLHGKIERKNRGELF